MAAAVRQCSAGDCNWGMPLAVAATAVWEISLADCGCCRLAQSATNQEYLLLLLLTPLTPHFALFMRCAWKKSSSTRALTQSSQCTNVATYSLVHVINRRCCCCMPQLKQYFACGNNCCFVIVLKLPAAWLIICLYSFNYDWMFFRCTD